MGGELVGETVERGARGGVVAEHARELTDARDGCGRDLHREAAVVGGDERIGVVGAGVGWHVSQPVVAHRVGGPRHHRRSERRTQRERRAHPERVRGGTRIGDLVEHGDRVVAHAERGAGGGELAAELHQCGPGEVEGGERVTGLPTERDHRRTEPVRLAGGVAQHPAGAGEAGEDGVAGRLVHAQPPGELGQRQRARRAARPAAPWWRRPVRWAVTSSAWRTVSPERSNIATIVLNICGVRRCTDRSESIPWGTHARARDPRRHAGRRHRRRRPSRRHRDRRREDHRGRRTRRARRLVARTAASTPTACWSRPASSTSTPTTTGRSRGTRCCRRRAGTA